MEIRDLELASVLLEKGFRLKGHYVKRGKRGNIVFFLISDKNDRGEEARDIIDKFMRLELTCEPKTLFEKRDILLSIIKDHYKIEFTYQVEDGELT